ncbi:MAG: hypothetical protein QOG50_554 [Actinomycetota bacterium]|jgi:hypothetical protein|nr:hypothetical protein [Actinomycetota bacterium]
MAAIPKRSFRRTVASTVEERSPGFLLSSLALAMVISLLAGLAIGIKIGHHDNSNNSAPAAVVKPKTPTTVRPTAKSKRAPLVGSIVRKTPKLLVVKSKTGRASLSLVAKTVVEATTPGGPADIKAGAHVLFVVKPATTSPTTTTAPGLTSSSAATPTTRPAPPTAKEIVVVTGSKATRGGAVVASVTANSMTFKLGRITVTVLTTGARILKTIPAKPVDLTVGKHVLVRAYLPAAVKKTKKTKKGAAVLRRRIALEIVMLPLDTAFS